MKNILFLLSLGLSLVSFAQEGTTCARSSKLLKTFDDYHVEPRKVDLAYAQDVMKFWANSMDSRGDVLSLEDVELMKTWAPLLLEDFNESTCQVWEKVAELFENSLDRADSVVVVLRKERINLNEKDALIVDDNEKYVKTEDIVDQKRKWIKYELLIRQFNASTDSTGIDLEEIKTRTFARAECKLESKRKSYGDLGAYVRNKQLNAMAFAMDPHSGYLNGDQFREFERHVSSDQLSFGIEIGKNDIGEIEVLEVVPGSPAWKSGEIHKGEVILEVESSLGYKDFGCILMSDISSFFSELGTEPATFRMRDEGGKQKTVVLTREETEIEENVINSFVLEGERKVGYLHLPSFYSEDTGPFGETDGCANDLAKELIRLKRENIEGLIIDLRYNGGGYMHEAIKMAGIFIDYGAVVISKYKDGDPETMKDMNRGTVYQDPLIVLVNETSASASEMFSSAMQDHNRAVIVGSQTYGKGTMQIPMEVGKAMGEFSAVQGGDQDYVYLTIGQYFRVNGESVQLTGTVPDVKLPSEYVRDEIGEVSYPHAMQHSFVDKKTYYTPWPELPIDDLVSGSGARIAKSVEFGEIERLKKEEIEGNSLFEIPLDKVGFNDYLEKRFVEEDKMSISELYKVKNPSYLQTMRSSEDSEKIIFHDVIDRLARDIYVEEAYNIVSDLITITK